MARQCGDHGIEVGGAAGRDGRVLLEVSRRQHRGCQLAELFAVTSGRLHGLVNGRGRQRALVAGDAGDGETGRTTGRGRDGECLVQAATPGTAGGMPELDEDAKVAAEASPGEDAVEPLHALNAVHVAHERELGVNRQLVRQPGDARLVHGLVRQQDITDAELPEAPHLRHGGRRDAARTRAQLLREDLRRHGGLPVREQCDLVSGAVLRHRADVVGEGLAAQEHPRRAQEAGAGLGSLGGELLGGDRVPVRRAAEALLSGCDRPTPQLGDPLLVVHRPPPHPGAVQSGIRHAARRPTSRTLWPVVERGQGRRGPLSGDRSSSWSWSSWWWSGWWWSRCSTCWWTVRWWCWRWCRRRWSCWEWCRRRWSCSGWCRRRWSCW